MNRAVYFILAAIAVFVFRTASHAADPAKKLSLPEGLRIAASDSRAVKIEAFSKEISGTDVVSARARFLPNINAFAGRTYLSQQPGAFMGGQQVYTSEKNYASYGINTYQTLFDFGQNSSLLEASKSSHALSALALKKTKNLAALAFLSAYFDILESEKMINIANKEVERLEAHRSAAKNLYDEGAITRNDLLQAEVRLSDAKQRLLGANASREICAMRLNNILALPLSAAIGVEEYDKEPIIAPEPDLLKTHAAGYRVELMMIDREIKTAKLDEAARRSDYFPKLFAQGGYNYTENRYQLHDGNWSVMLGLNMDLFSGLNTDASVSKARYKTAQLLERKQQISEEIMLQVRQAYLETATASERMKVARNSVEQAEENLRINKVRYSEGIGTATEVLDAISLLTASEMNHYKSRYDLRRAQAALLYASGYDLISEYQ